MQLNEFYAGLLGSMGITADEQGHLSLRLRNGQDNFESSVLTIDNRRLVLPLDTQLRNPDWSNRIAFHPLSESVVRTGESKVLGMLKRMVHLRLTEVLSTLLLDLSDLAQASDEHPSISPNGTVLLEAMPEADAKTRSAAGEMMAKVGLEGDHQLISVYLKRGGQLDGRKHAYVGVARFPFLESIDEAGSTILGVKVRRKDFAAFRRLFELVLPNADDSTHYSAASDSQAAPQFDALMRVYALVAKRLNAVVHLYRKHLADEDYLRSDLDWVDQLDNLNALQVQVPPLEGNQGEHRVIDDQPSAPAVSNASPPWQTPAAPTTPKEETVEAKSRGKGQIFSEVMRQREARQYANAPAPMPPYGGFQYGTPAPMVPPAPMAAPPPAPPPPAPAGYGAPQNQPAQPTATYAHRDYMAMVRQSGGGSGFNQPHPAAMAGWGGAPAVDAYGRPLPPPPPMAPDGFPVNWPRDSYGRPAPADQYGRPMVNVPPPQYGNAPPPMAPPPMAPPPQQFDMYGRPLPMPAPPPMGMQEPYGPYGPIGGNPTPMHARTAGMSSPMMPDPMGSTPAGGLAPRAGRDAYGRPIPGR